MKMYCIHMTLIKSSYTILIKHFGKNVAQIDDAKNKLEKLLQDHGHNYSDFTEKSFIVSVSPKFLNSSEICAKMFSNTLGKEWIVTPITL